LFTTNAMLKYAVSLAPPAPPPIPSTFVQIASMTTGWRRLNTIHTTAAPG
jgi:hypothetical protein